MFDKSPSSPPPIQAFEGRLQRGPSGVELVKTQPNTTLDSRLHGNDGTRSISP